MVAQGIRPGGPREALYRRRCTRAARAGAGVTEASQYLGDAGARVLRQHRARGVHGEAVYGGRPAVARRVGGYRQRHPQGRAGVTPRGPGAGALRRGPVQRRRRSPRSRHALVSSPNGKRARVSPATRARTAALRKKGLRDGSGLHRPVAPAVPLRPALSCRHRDHANRSREADSIRLPVPTCRLLDAAGPGGNEDRPRESEECHPVPSSCDGQGVAIAGRRPFGWSRILASPSRIPSRDRTGIGGRVPFRLLVGPATRSRSGVPVPGPHEDADWRSPGRDSSRGRPSTACCLRASRKIGIG